MTKLIVGLMALAASSLMAPAAVAYPAATAEGDIPLAEAFWGRTPTGCSSITFRTDPLPGRSGEATQPEPGAAPVPCNLVIHEVDADHPPESVCLVALHEYGHLLGEAHSDDPASVMYPGVSTQLVVPICETARMLNAPAELRRDELYEARKLRRWCKEARGPYRRRCSLAPSTSQQHDVLRGDGAAA